MFFWKKYQRVIQMISKLQNSDSSRKTDLETSSLYGKVQKIGRNWLVVTPPNLGGNTYIFFLSENWSAPSNDWGGGGRRFVWRYVATQTSGKEKLIGKVVDKDAIHKLMTQ